MPDIEDLEIRTSDDGVDTEIGAGEANVNIESSGPTPEEVEKQQEAAGKRMVNDIQEALNGIRSEATLYEQNPNDPSGNYMRTMAALRDGYFPAFVNGTEGSTHETMTDEANMYNTLCTLDAVARLVGDGFVNLLRKNLLAWTTINRQNPELGSRLAQRIVALQLTLPAPAEITDVSAATNGEAERVLGGKKDKKHKKKKKK